jgi:hypothetical protein
MLLHANAIAKNRAAAERAGRVDREDADLTIAFAQNAYELMDQCTFPGAGRSRNSDDACLAGASGEFSQKNIVAWGPVLDKRSGAGKGARIAVENVGGQIRYSDAVSSRSTSDRA